MLNNSNCVCDVLDKKFVLINELFNKYDWKINEHTESRVVYYKKGSELDTFEITIDLISICILVPLKNSNYSYETKFTDYFSAIAYIESKILDLA
jgi:hypothetical protein